MAQSKSGRKCRQFYCDHRRDRYCCRDCPEPCSNPCLNSPEKCGLVEVPEPVKRGRKVSFDEDYARKLWGRGMTDAEIGEAMGFHRQTIYCWRKRVGLGTSKKKGWRE